MNRLLHKFREKHACVCVPLLVWTYSIRKKKTLNHICCNINFTSLVTPVGGTCWKGYFAVKFRIGLMVSEITQPSSPTRQTLHENYAFLVWYLKWMGNLSPALQIPYFSAFVSKILFYNNRKPNTRFVVLWPHWM